MNIAAGQEQADDHHATIQLLPDSDRLNIDNYIDFFLRINPEHPKPHAETVILGSELLTQTIV